MVLTFFIPFYRHRPVFNLMPLKATLAAQHFGLPPGHLWHMRVRWGFPAHERERDFFLTGNIGALAARSSSLLPPMMQKEVREAIRKEDLNCRTVNRFFNRWNLLECYRSSHATDGEKAGPGWTLAPVACLLFLSPADCRTCYHAQKSILFQGL